MTTKDKSMTGVFWGAFDPPTKAHIAIIEKALSLPELRHILIIINNHSYKNYRSTLQERLDQMTILLSNWIPHQITLLTQDDAHPMNFTKLSTLTNLPLCAISGYDAYLKWAQYSSDIERSHYASIAVVPRGDIPPILFDEQAFLMPIDPTFKHTSSSQEHRNYHSDK
jgi:cytidyltransferase-like protein